MARGVLILNSAGNSGPGAYSVGSIAPWMVSVAASTIDRRFINKVVLGNGKTLVGASISSFTSNGTKGCLDSKLVKGKIVLCNTPMTTAALGSISQGRFELLVPFPVSFLGHRDFNRVVSYYNSTKCGNPHAKILKSESIKDNSAPVVASFSSRGPNKIIPEIMKPDLTAPGVHILAAYSPVASPSGEAADKRSFHPDWSPSVIQSALMTTAWPLNPTTNPDGVLAYGSGHVDPIKATDTGLVYEALKDDYITMLCSMGYGEHKLRLISRDNSTCPKNSKGFPKDLNYPSMTVKVVPKEPFKVLQERIIIVQVYIVYLGSLPKGEFSPMSQHIRVLEDVLEGRPRLPMQEQDPISFTHDQPSTLELGISTPSNLSLLNHGFDTSTAM
ncbi:Subtilisin-like protease SBT4.5 [Vitis vinifera]|uniref:Subtilisin-like protease SBT4.5 n=1 Tax=Vitis vinifera TaxID=29760 RepID=A0A438F9L5_VITVI|nr:Subtilisin-like protease SBT4.5 [Vitis vinifera]